MSSLGKYTTLPPIPCIRLPVCTRRVFRFVAFLYAIIIEVCLCFNITRTSGLAVSLHGRTSHVYQPLCLNLVLSDPSLFLPPDQSVNLFRHPLLKHVNSEPTPPSLSTLTLPITQLRQTLPSLPHHLAVGALIIISPSPSSSHLALILQRTSTDAFPSLYDVPGGGVESSDLTLISALEREVFEETGLRVSRVVDVVHSYEWEWRVGWARRITTGTGGGERKRKFVFLVEVKEMECLKEEEKIGVKIKLAEREHQAYRWIGEGEIDERLDGRREMDFISRDEVEGIKKGFAQWRAFNGQR